MNDTTGTDTVGPIVIASNRLPVVVSKGSDGQWSLRPGSGGLVTALAPVLRDRGGVWVGWTGVDAGSDAPIDDLLMTAHETAGYDLEPVALDAKDREGFYYGFSNAMIWPLFHDLQGEASFVPEHWRAYLVANTKFAEAIRRRASSESFIWVHDYHLMDVGRQLREMGSWQTLAFFLHIPFPPLDIFLRLPWRNEVLTSLLAYDLVGFQTVRDRRNFLQCVRRLVPDVRVHREGRLRRVHHGGRQTLVGDFPIGIDFDEFADHAQSKDVADEAWFVHENLPERKLILGVDRLDYTKGIPHRLEALRHLLQEHPEWHGKLQLMQIVVPSRTDVPGYRELKETIERLVGEINGQFTGSGWVPIHYIFRSLDRTELLGYYRTSEVALVTSLKDGMNLVAKEYCASSVEDRGVLVLSEFAGAAQQMAEGALLVNPHDIEGTAAALIRALTMPVEEQQSRMRRLRQVVRESSVFWWVDAFLEAGAHKHLLDFPRRTPFPTGFKAGGGVPEGP